MRISKHEIGHLLCLVGLVLILSGVGSMFFYDKNVCENSKIEDYYYDCTESRYNPEQNRTTIACEYRSYIHNDEGMECSINWLIGKNQNFDYVTYYRGYTSEEAYNYCVSNIPKELKGIKILVND